MKRRNFYLAFVNLVPAAFFLFLAQLKFFRHIRQGGHWEFSHVLLIIHLIIIAYFFIARQAPKSVSHRLSDVVIALIGTFAPYLFSIEEGGDRHWLGLFLQVFGSILSLYSILSLNRSIGIIPANRGIQTGGMYRFVRHPLYFSYQVANLGYVINHFSVYNIEVLLIGFLCQVMRVFAEERLLSEDPEYQMYQRKVRWRLFPGIF